MPQIPLRKYVLEWRYAPQLTFYGQVDRVGIELAARFPDWERSPLTLELRNLKEHRRLYLSFTRSFLDHDEPKNTRSDIEDSARVMERSCSILSLQALSRVGLRQWFAFPMEQDTEALVHLVADKFLRNDDRISKIVCGSLRDVAYVVDLVQPQGWKFNVRLGPMDRKQWLQFVTHERAMFEHSEKAERTFEAFLKTLPECFIYVDIDCFWEDLTLVDVLRMLPTARSNAYETASGLVSYMQEKS